MTGLGEKFGGGSWERAPACGLPAHYPELQALCDALGHAAQQEMAAAIEHDDAIGRERAYGKWLGVRGILRAIEARADEWTPLEWAMLERIDWDRNQFRFPGIEAFEEAAPTEPGAHLAGSLDMPRGVKEGSKRARQYEHIKEFYQERGVSTDEAEERAARTVNKTRRKKGEAKSPEASGFVREAATVFGDPLALTYPDPDHSASEQRLSQLECRRLSGS